MLESVRVAATSHDVEAYRAAPPFAVSAVKLTVMTLVTFGVYEVYWAYKHWQAERERERESLSPFWRAVFAPLWGFSLFPRLQRLTAKHNLPAGWSGGGLAMLYFVLNYTWRLPDPYWLAAFLTVVPLILVQRAINAVTAAVAPEAPRNDTYSGVNVIGILVGGLLLLLALLGTLLPEPDPGAVTGRET